MIVSAKFFIPFFKNFIDLFDRDSQREREHKQGEWERRSRLLVEEPDVGLDPRMQGSRPEQRQRLNDCATEATPA